MERAYRAETSVRHTSRLFLIVAFVCFERVQFRNTLNLNMIRDDPFHDGACHLKKIFQDLAGVTFLIASSHRSLDLKGLVFNTCINQGPFASGACGRLYKIVLKQNTRLSPLTLGKYYNTKEYLVIRLSWEIRQTGRSAKEEFQYRTCDNLFFTFQYFILSRTH